MEFIFKLFSADFMPHVYCLRLPEVIWLFVVANGAIALAYFCIPPTLFFFIRKRRDIAFSWMFVLFGTFILACGTTHVLDIVTLWNPIYRFDVVIRLLTAIASIATAVLLVRIMPQALLLPNPQQLRDEITKRTEIQHQLEDLNSALEQRVLERTATLNATNHDLEKALVELRFQLELNRAVMKQAGDCILCTDSEGNVSFANPQTEKAFGYTAEELLGQSLHKMLHVSPLENSPLANLPSEYPADDSADCTLAKAATEGLSLHDWSTQFFRRDGAAVQVACSASPIEVSGVRSGSVIIARDVTERAKAERALKESERQYRTLVEAMPQLVWSARSDGYIDYFSSQWVEYTGKPDVDQFGQQWFFAVHPMDAEATRQAWQSSLLSLSNYEIEHRLRRSDGTWRWFKSRAVALLSEDGKPDRWLGTSTDIDADKQAAAVLEQFNADLKNLSSAMAHDLHEPLRSIAVQTQMLARHVQDELHGNGAEIVLRVIESATRMRCLLKDISLYSETITRPLHTQGFDLCHLVQACRDRFSDQLQRSSASVHVDFPPTCFVTADLSSIRLVLDQLFLNAIAYRRTDLDLKIDISAKAIDSELVVSFADNGSGIKPEYYERIFQLFKRLHNQHDHPGSGLGLALCRKILQRHGKRIWVSSNYEGGATFFFSLESAWIQQEGVALLHAPAAS